MDGCAILVKRKYFIIAAMVISRYENDKWPKISSGISLIHTSTLRTIVITKNWNIVTRVIFHQICIAEPKKHTRSGKEI